MAFLRNKGTNAIEVIHESQPKKIVINTGPSFGTVGGLLLLGAAIGAAGVLCFKGKPSTPDSGGDALYEGLSAGGAKDGSALNARVNAAMKRLKSVASRARDTIHSAFEAIAPAMQDAIAEAKRTASKTEHDLNEELEKAKEGNKEI